MRARFNRVVRDRQHRQCRPRRVAQRRLRRGGDALGAAAGCRQPAAAGVLRTAAARGAAAAAPPSPIRCCGNSATRRASPTSSPMRRRGWSACRCRRDGAGLRRRLERASAATATRGWAGRITSSGAAWPSAGCSGVQVPGAPLAEYRVHRDLMLQAVTEDKRQQAAGDGRHHRAPSLALAGRGEGDLGGAVPLRRRTTRSWSPSWWPRCRSTRRCRAPSAATMSATGRSSAPPCAISACATGRR